LRQVIMNCPLVLGEKLSESLINIFDTQHQTLWLLKKVIIYEIDATQTDTTLFRSNSIVTKFIKLYTDKVGGEYLKKTLTQPVKDLINSGDTLEVFPSKLPQSEALTQNIEKLKNWSQIILDRIVNSVEECPWQIRVICHHLKVEVSKKFPKVGNRIIGGYIFLRYFCPAIMVPEFFHLISEVPSPVVRRALVLITKCLQNVANNTNFGGDSEPYLKTMNQFIESNVQIVKTYFEKISTLDTVVPEKSPSKEIKISEISEGDYKQLEEIVVQLFLAGKLKIENHLHGS